MVRNLGLLVAVLIALLGQNAAAQSTYPTATYRGSTPVGNLPKFEATTGRMVDSGIGSTTTGSGSLVLGTAPTLTRPTIAGGTVTSSSPALDISQTWNNGAVAFTGIKANFTNTASSTSSLLMDLQVGGSSLFQVGRDNVWAANVTSIGPTPYRSTIDLEVRDVNADGYVEARLAKDTLNFTAWYFHPSNVGFIEVWTWSGASSFDISPKPWDGSITPTDPRTSNAEMSVFRNSPPSTGTRLFRVYAGDMTATYNHSLSGKGNSGLQVNAGMLGVGTESPLATLHVFIDRGNVTSEIARFSDADRTIGLSLGTNDSGTSASYIRHVYAGSVDAKIGVNFGADFTSNVVAEFFKDKRTKLYGQTWVADNTVIGSTSLTAAALLHLASNTTEKLKLTAAADGTLGLSLGYTPTSTTNAYFYNTYSGNAASAIKFGFGDTYESLVALTLTKDLHVAAQATAAVATSLAIGQTTASSTATLLVKAASGTVEKARLIGNDGTVGLSLGYSEAANTTAYLYNRYSGGTPSAISLGFGSAFGSLVALTLTKDLNTAFGGVAKLGAFTVSTLPTASSWAGAVAYVTDLASTTRGATATGSGSSKGMVWSDGTNWLVM